VPRSSKPQDLRKRCVDQRTLLKKEPFCAGILRESALSAGRLDFCRLPGPGRHHLPQGGYDWRPKKANTGTCEQPGRTVKRREFLKSVTAASAGLALSEKLALADDSTKPPSQATDWEMLDHLRRSIVGYCRNESNPRNGLIADRTQPGSPASIAAVGMGLSVYIVAAERGMLSRADAVDRTLALLRFLHSSH
jgi:hypothetical protein